MHVNFYTRSIKLHIHNVRVHDVNVCSYITDSCQNIAPPKRYMRRGFCTLVLTYNVCRFEPDNLHKNTRGPEVKLRSQINFV